MIYWHSNETQTRWDRGEYAVRLQLPARDKPVGFCDGSDEDIRDLQARAESEGVDAFRIEKKTLKTGREIWTLHGEERGPS